MKHAKTCYRTVASEIADFSCVICAMVKTVNAV